MKKNILFSLFFLLLIFTLTGCDKPEKVEVINGEQGQTTVVSNHKVEEFIGEYYYNIDKNTLVINVAEEEGQIVYFLSYYPENSTRASEEIKGKWSVKDFNTKDNNVMPYSLANYDISKINLSEDKIIFDIKLTDYIAEDYKDHVIPDGSYTLSKRKYIVVDGHKLNYGTYTCSENGNKLILREDGTFTEKYGISISDMNGTFAVENYDISQDNSKDMHECVVVRSNEGSHGGFIAKSDYSLKDGEWFVYEFTSYDQE